MPEASGPAGTGQPVPAGAVRLAAADPAVAAAALALSTEARGRLAERRGHPAGEGRWPGPPPASHNRRMSGSRPLLLDRRPAERLRVGDCVVDVLAREVVRDADGQRSRVTFKSLGVLFALVAQRGEVVSRETLLQWVWPRTMPTEDVLNQAVTQLRKAFGDDADQPRYIQTIARTGYRLLAEVEWLTPPAAASSQDAPAQPDAAGASSPGHPAPRFRRPVLVLAASLAAVAIVLAVANTAGLAEGWRRPAPASYRLHALERITAHPHVESAPTLSPDGTQLAFVMFAPEGGATLMVQATGQAPPRALTEPRAGVHDVMPAWSPDGRQIAFARVDMAGGSCRILLVPATGGAEREAGSCLHDDTSGFSWHPDGTRLIADGVSKDPARHAGIETLDLATGTWTPVPYARGEGDVDMLASYSPDGRWIAFQRNISLSDLWIMPATGGTPRRLTRMRVPIDGLAWTRDSRAIVFSAFQSGRFHLFSVDIDGARVSALDAPGARRPATALRSDALGFAIDDSTRQLHLVEDASQPDATPVALFPSSGNDVLPSLSPDGSQLVFVSNRSGRVGLWWARLDAPQSLRVIEDVVPMPRFGASWSEDGERVLVVGEPGGTATLYEVEVGSGRATRLPVPGGGPIHAAYLPDDRLLVISGHGEGRPRMARYDRRTEPWRLEAAIDDVAFARVDAARARVLFTRPMEWGVWQTGLALGPATRISERPYFDGGRRLALGAEGALLAESDPDAGCGLRWRALDAPGAQTPSCRVSGPMIRDLSLAARRPRLVYSLGEDRQDIAVARLSGGPAPATPQAAVRGATP